MGLFFPSLMWDPVAAGRYMAQLKCRKVEEVLLILLEKETLVPQISIDRDTGADTDLKSRTKFWFLKQNVKTHDTFKH